MIERMEFPRKLTAATGTAILALGFAGCSGQRADTKPSTSPNTGPTSTQTFEASKPTGGPVPAENCRFDKQHRRPASEPLQIIGDCDKNSEASVGLLAAPRRGSAKLGELANRLALKLGCVDKNGEATQDAAGSGAPDGSPADLHDSNTWLKVQANGQEGYIWEGWAGFPQQAIQAKEC